MKITFLESGGFAGSLRGVSLEVASLPDPERVEVERLVAGCGLDRSCECFAEPGRDRRQYDLAVARAGQVVRLSCDDASVPETARPLVAFLQARATPQGPGFELIRSPVSPRPSSGPRPTPGAGSRARSWPVGTTTAAR
jgi:hypothetical protein